MEDDSQRGYVSNGSETGDPDLELKVLHDVVAALRRLPDNDLRSRVLQAAMAFFRIGTSSPAPSQPLDNSWDSGKVSGQQSTKSNFWGGFAQLPQAQSPVAFSEDRTSSPKEFLISKQPQTEVERVACLAFYLTHYRDTSYFKTIDISGLNTEAAQPKFTNASQAVENALKTHYLAPASKGLKQLSGPGEVFVQNLPDREAARAAMNSVRPRRRKKSGQQTNNLEEKNGDE